jgi:hypothetical protein
MEFFDEINNTQYLFLTDIKHLANNKLLITINEARISQIEEDIIVSDKNLGPAKSILPGNGKQYNIFFNSYASYQVTNESFATPESGEEKVGRLLCVLSRSSYLTYVKEVTIASYAYAIEKDLMHYSIICQNHIIDIISIDEPLIKMIS